MAEKAPPPAYVQPYSNEYIDSLYKRFGQIESSGGKNSNHKTLKKGPNKGQTAGGETGIVPGSLTDFIKQSKKHGLAVDPEIEALSNESPDDVTEALNTDSDLDRKAFDIAIRRVLQKTGGDDKKTAYAWNRGHNRDFDKLSQEKLDNNRYVQDFMKTGRDERAAAIRESVDKLNSPHEKIEVNQQIASESPNPIPNDYTPDVNTPIADEDKLRALRIYRNGLN